MPSFTTPFLMLVTVCCLPCHGGVKLVPEWSCGVQRVDLIHTTCSDAKGLKKKMVTLWCGFMSQSCNYTVLAATLSCFTFLCDVNKVTTQLCSHVGFPKVLPSLV